MTTTIAANARTSVPPSTTAEGVPGRLDPVCLRDDRQALPDPVACFPGRRALGALPRHIVLHVVVDTAAIGAIGGLVGGIAGLTATLAVTASQGWIPVIDHRVMPATIAGGLLIGALAGVYPARVGARLQPTDALRR